MCSASPGARGPNGEALAKSRSVLGSDPGSDTGSDTGSDIGAAKATMEVTRLAIPPDAVPPWR